MIERERRRNKLRNRNHEKEGRIEEGKMKEQVRGNERKIEGVHESTKKKKKKTIVELKASTRKKSGKNRKQCKGKLEWEKKERKKTEQKRVAEYK